ncbi:hypothetical protein QA447_14795 [Pseudomonas sp. abacavir_1]
MNSSYKPKSRIQRTFCELSQKGVTDIEQASILARMKQSGAFDWGKLLESQRILIISEAGAGKTYECRMQQQALWELGDPAFYLELAELATNNLRDLLSTEEETRFDAWLVSQSDVATIFLDSIDELKLTLGSFETALKRLSKAISGQLSRVQIVITTRPINIDQQLIKKYLPIPIPHELIASDEVFANIAMGLHQRKTDQNNQDTVPQWRTVALMPLSDDQIREMAEIEGISDTSALLADIRKRNAEDFARRPQDLIELCADWREHRRIRTHREQVIQNINIKLKPRTDRPEPAQLSPDKAFEGASRLALAVLLTRKIIIRLSVEADRGENQGTSLDPSMVLHDWTAKERQTLLERALFGFASYGRVRFHHRSVIEFLAAQRLEDRLQHGMPIKAVKRLLFAETSQEVRLVRPSMRPVGAWLANSRPSIFSEICGREPEVLLNHGDPESLLLPQRIDALQSYIQHHGRGGWRGLHTPRLQVQRFATPDLADHVQKLWQAGVENPEARELLLQIIGAAPITTCSDIAYEVANDSNATHGERLHGIEALIQLEDPRVETLIKSMTDSPEKWPERLIRSVVVWIFPNHINPEYICQILESIQEHRRSHLNEFIWMLPQRIAELKFSPDYLATLRKGLTDLISRGLTWRQAWPHLASGYSYLAPMLAAVCTRQIQDGETDITTLQSAVIALRLGREDHDCKEPIQQLKKLLEKLPPPSREAVFWADDAFNENLHPESDPWRRMYNSSFDGPLILNGAKDGFWVQRILADTDHPTPERTMMLHAALCGIWPGTNESNSHIKELRQYVIDQPELIDLVEKHLAPQKINPEMAKFETRQKRQRQIREKRELKKHAAWMAFWREVAEHPETAFSPDCEAHTTWNLWQAMQNSDQENSMAGWNRRFIEKYFNKEVADRLRNSMRTVWRNDRPTLRYERPQEEKCVTLLRWQLGLAAITAEAEDLNWAHKLSAEEARLAARYAPLEGSGYPTWLEDLARAHPDAVEETLGIELTVELDEIATPRSFAILLQNISYSSATVAQLFLPRLLAWLDTHTINLSNRENETVIFERLERVLDILLKHGDEETRKHICSMAEDRLKVTEIGLSTQIWLTALMCLDPAKGTDTIERLLLPLEPAPTGQTIDIFGNIFGDRHNILRADLSSIDFTPTILLRLTRLAYLHVRPSDDIIHEGVYSPDSRDHAQSGRNSILSGLLNTKGAKAWAVKLEMAADPLFSHFRDRLTLLAREKAAEETDSAALTESEVAILNSYGEAPPTTRDDMFSTLVDRLDDLEDLLLQDTSPRDTWALIKDEKLMRREIARVMQNAANSIYTVDQEAVTADEKETDIRLRALSGQQGVIELKLGENCSGRTLRDTIRNQLVARYMAAENCRSGCLLVTVASNCSWQHPDTGDKLDIHGLRVLLEGEAANTVNEMGDCLRLTIKVIDLRPRLKAKTRQTTS